MFHTNKFKYTRMPEVGETMKREWFPEQFEGESIYEDIDMNTMQRGILKNYGPDPISFEHEDPHRNYQSKYRLNLRHTGFMDSTEPYMNPEFDTQFHDKDPRGYLQEQPWREFRRNMEPKLRLQPFSKDHDHSLPTGDNVSPVDMVSQLVKLRKDLRGRINWFSESDNSIMAGRGYQAQYKGGDEVILEDTSSTVDINMLDSVQNQSVNRLLSNNLHTGGKYFIDRTTPDHIVPVASYGLVFKSAEPKTPKQIAEMTIGDQKLTTLDRTMRARNFIKFLNSRDIHYKTSDGRRFDRIYDKQNKNSQQALNKDIMAILGITENEVKWLQSIDNKNNKQAKLCIANIIDMVEMVEKLPPNARLEVRNSLLREHPVAFCGGISNTVMNPKIKNILESRNNLSKVSEYKKPEHFYDNKFGGSIDGRGGKSGTGRVDITEKARIEKYNFLFARAGNKKGPTGNVDNIDYSVSEEFAGVINEIKNKKNKHMEYRRLYSKGDIDYSQEKHIDYDVKSWDKSHLNKNKKLGKFSGL